MRARVSVDFMGRIFVSAELGGWCGRLWICLPIT